MYVGIPCLPCSCSHESHLNKLPTQCTLVWFLSFWVEQGFCISSLELNALCSNLLPTYGQPLKHRQFICALSVSVFLMFTRKTHNIGFIFSCKFSMWIYMSESLESFAQELKLYIYRTSLLASERSIHKINVFKEKRKPHTESKNAGGERREKRERRKRRERSCREGPLNRQHTRASENSKKQ